MSPRRCAAAILVGLCGVALGGPAARAQEAAAGPDPTAPGAEHRTLDPLAGTWDVTVKYVIAPGREHEGTATCESKWALDGRFLRQEYSSRIGGRPFTVLQYLGFDRAKKKYVELHLDSMDTGVMLNEGTISGDGKTITCTGPRTDPEGGKPGTIRTVTTLVDPDTYTLEWFLREGDGPEARAVSMTHRRRKAP